MADYHREANWDSQLILKINKYYIRKGRENQTKLHYRELWKEHKMRGAESEENRGIKETRNCEKQNFKKKWESNFKLNIKKAIK